MWVDGRYSQLLLAMLDATQKECAMTASSSQEQLQSLAHMYRQQLEQFAVIHQEMQITKAIELDRYCFVLY